MISSEYPETRERFLVLAVNEEEMLVEKIIAMIERKREGICMTSGSCLKEM